MENKADYPVNIKPHIDNSVNGIREIIGSGILIKQCKNNAIKIAKTDAPVLITGASGTGKELFANLVFEKSKRRNKPFIEVNCAAIPESLIETELFGHLKGAFTDAIADRKGKFISADNGTIFLDEICELPYHIQSRLLKVIESGSINSLGSDEVIKVNIAIKKRYQQFQKKIYNKGAVSKQLEPEQNIFCSGHSENIPIQINERTGNK